MIMTPRQRVVRKRRIENQPGGWGQQALEERAAKSAAIMRNVDGMPPEFRELVYEFGYNKVWPLMRDGYSAESVSDLLEDI